jgi:ribose/xylose/arabinose/galactoside ABC-type transport system permease subunit
MLAVVSGIFNGLFTAPMKMIPGWKWENIWLVFIVTACLLMPAGMVIVIGLLGAGALGAVNGLLVVYGRLQPFIATLAMMSIARGFAFLWTHGRGIDLIGDEPRLFEFLGSDLGPIPVQPCFL